MKVVLILATLFVLVSMLLNAARRRGKLSDDANRAVAGLASSMRIFVYGLLFFVAIACLALAWHSL